ncbi:F-box protein At4g35930 isoform X2 [Punica granatum]|uniref:F-box protein At4g35930 isoform X2 n=1 Tax=Punica granatum TaxID=22663 RepID=A0A6P8CUH1_PUNGR|nr:F-box protein At4g35930 isoform X2 [Punica granatum]
MGKVLPPERDSKRLRQKRRSRGSGNKYLKPGALAQLRYSKPLSTRSCTDLGKKRVAVLDAKKGEENLVIEDKPLDSTPLMLSPVSLVKQSNVLQEGAEKGLDHAVIESTPIDRSPVFSSPINYSKQNNLLRTPKTPRFDDCDTESRLEALPMDLLVKILCHLHHDQLKAVFHVSQRMRRAVLIARQFHFNYTTPDRSRQEMLRMITPRPTDHWPFKRGEGKGTPLRSPLAPKAPRQGPRPPSRIKISEMRQIAAVLFQEKSTFPSRCIVPSVLSKPLCKSLASNRALFYEDELCQAVAQNKLR